MTNGCTRNLWFIEWIALLKSFILKNFINFRLSSHHMGFIERVAKRPLYKPPQCHSISAHGQGMIVVQYESIWHRPCLYAFICFVFTCLHKLPQDCYQVAPCDPREMPNQPGTSSTSWAFPRKLKETLVTSKLVVLENTIKNSHPEKKVKDIHMVWGLKNGH